MYKYILFIALLPTINTILCTVYYILLIYYRKKTTTVSRVDNPYVYIPYVGIFEYICITYFYKPRVMGYWFVYVIIKDKKLKIFSIKNILLLIPSLAITYITNIPFIFRKFTYFMIKIYAEKQKKRVTIFRLLRNHLLLSYSGYCGNIAIIILDYKYIIANPFDFKRFDFMQKQTMQGYTGWLKTIKRFEVASVISKTPRGVLKEHPQLLGSNHADGVVGTHLNIKDGDVYTYKSTILDQNTKLIVSVNDNTVNIKIKTDFDQKDLLFKRESLNFELDRLKNLEKKTVVIHNSNIDNAYYKWGVKVVDTVNNENGIIEEYFKYQELFIKYSISQDTIKYVEMCVSNDIDPFMDIIIDNIIDKY